MSVQDVATIGSSTSHGGTIISGDERITVNNKPIARKGDLHSCPIPGHGINKITDACVETFIIDGQPVARVTSICACGAVITTGEPMKV